MPHPGPLARFVLVAALCAVAAPQAAAETLPAAEPPLMRLVQRPEDQALVVNLTLNRTSIGDNIIVYAEKGRLLVPFNGIMAALELAITADPETGKASGFFIREDRRFTLDLGSGAARVDGKTFALTPDKTERQLTDIYVDASLLEQWFSIRLRLSMEDLALVVSSVELLPVEERMERERRRSGVFRGGERGDYRLVEPPSPWIDWPFIDTTVQFATNRQSGHMAEQGQFTSIVTGIVGGLDLDMSANGVLPAQSGTNSLRATLGRRDPRGGLLGPLDAREFLVGDISSPTLALVSNSVTGRGGTVSTFPLHRLSDLQRVTLRGELPVGWEVELYRGADLIDFQTSNTTGRYEFLNVPTIPGLNAFRFMFYGPEGQRREEEQPIFVSAATVDAGETGFRLFVNQQNTDLLGNRPTSQPLTQFNRFDLLTQNQLLSQPQINNGAVRFTAEAEHGFTDTLSLNGAVSSLPIAGKESQFFQTGLRAGWLGTLTNIDVATSNSGGIGYGAAAQSQLGSLSWLLSHDRFEHFVSERSFDLVLNQPLRSVSVGQLYGYVPVSELGRLPFNASATYNEAETGASRLVLDGRLSTFLYRYTFSAETQSNLQTGAATQTQEILRVGTQFGTLGLRGETIYDLQPKRDLNAARITADYSVRQNLNFRLGVTRFQTAPQETQFTAGAAVLFPHLALGVDTNVSDRGEFSVLLKLSFGFGVEPRSNSPVFRGETFARTGAVAPLVFLDRNGDGRFGPGDVPLPNVRFRGESAPLRDRTGADGAAFIAGLEPYQEQPIGIDLESLEDPFWKPGEQRVAVLPRPGQVVPLEFPVYETGEVDGAVELDRQGQRVPLPGIRLQVVDQSGTVIGQTLSGYDGSFFLQGVRLGQYMLRPDPDQLLRLHLAASSEQPVTLTRDNTAISAATITLSRSDDATAAPGAATQVTNQRQQPRREGEAEGRERRENEDGSGAAPGKALR